MTMPQHPRLPALGWAAAMAAAWLAVAPAAHAAPPPDSPAGRLAAAEALYPPWRGAANNDSVKRGLEFTVAPVDVLADFHGDPIIPALVLFVSGNYYFAMAPLVAAFEKANPQYLGKVYYETLPPGLLDDQLKAGGTITVGNMTWTVQADVYLADLQKMNAMIKQGSVAGPAVPYVTNQLTIMVPRGNPNHIGGLADLGRPGSVLVMPNPKWEGVARQIRASLVKAGGEALANQVYGTMVDDGTTILTRIHHRQTPLLLMQGMGQAGGTWTSEAVFQEQAGHPISHVVIPASQNTTAVYAAGRVAGSPHPVAAAAWLAFLTSPPAIGIFEHYGFKRYVRSP
jgi:ABC-type molybdate transport system substrate-binding protein